MTKQKTNKQVQSDNVECWEDKGFSCQYHAEGFKYFNRKEDTLEDEQEIYEYCGE